MRKRNDESTFAQKKKIAIVQGCCAESGLIRLWLLLTDVVVDLDVIAVVKVDGYAVVADVEVVEIMMYLIVATIA